MSTKKRLSYLDEEESELENLHKSTAYSKTVKDAILAPYRGDVKKAVTMRLSESTIEGLKQKAVSEGLPYQTLAAMVLQKYIRGDFLDREAVVEVVKALSP